MTAGFLSVNIPLMVLAFGLWVGIPLWMTFRRPDRHPQETRTVPAYLQRQTATAVPTQLQTAGRDRAERPELVGVGRSLQGPHSRDRSGAAISPLPGRSFLLA